MLHPCLEEPSADDIASISGCEHTFCAECIIRWAGTRNVCPLCRTLFASIESADGALQQVSLAGVLLLIIISSLQDYSAAKKSNLMMATESNLSAKHFGGPSMNMKRIGQSL